jgi:hypothetical protein
VQAVLYPQCHEVVVGYEANDDCIWKVCHMAVVDGEPQEGWNELPPPSLYPRKHREFLRAIVTVKTGKSFFKINLRALDAAYKIVFPNSTPINVNKKKSKKLCYQEELETTIR